MAEKIKETKPSKDVKVKALIQMASVGYSYFEGDEFEVHENLAEVWIENGIVEKVK